MPVVAFLSMEDLPHPPVDDELAAVALRAAGWSVWTIPWNDPVIDWSDFSAVVIRSTWDYQDQPERFLETLFRIERSGTRLANAAEVVRWNLHKSYLLDLQATGLPVVPTIVLPQLAVDDLEALFDTLHSPEVILKPAVSASAIDTFRLRRPLPASQIADLTTRFAHRAVLAQPFMPHVLSEGEFSLFFFGGRYSHAGLKTPARGDFRVQEEHGGQTRNTIPPPDALTTARSVMAAVTPAPLYARVDLVRADNGGFALMELELIEPVLYFHLDPAAPRRFVRAFLDWFDN